MLLALCMGKPAMAQLSRLRADGPRIVNASNQEVILKAVGLGGWLLQEGYMIKPSFSGGGTQWSIKKRLYDQGQSDAAVEAFYQGWRDNFITRADIDYLASLGFNCVRLPMHYELFLNNSQRAVRNSVARNSGNYTNYVNSLTTWYNNNQLFNETNLEGFRTIDSLLKWTAANNMYVILDLHAAPGAQGTDANISDALVGNDLWNRSIYKDITVRLWQRLSARYINNDGVAFYDLIN
ncbi:MAG TPA: cellulase family glycosylhydrolase, partial [Chitinophaga sp.]